MTYFGRLLFFYKRHFISYWSSKIASQANSRAPQHRLSRNGDPPTDKYSDMPCPSERRTAVASSSKNFYDADWQHTWYPVWVSGDMVLQMVLVRAKQERVRSDPDWRYYQYLNALSSVRLRQGRTSDSTPTFPGLITPSDKVLPFTFKRRQFPIRVAYAMTINKAQGQSFKRVGIYLPKPVFSHGQLYVALFRFGVPSKTKLGVVWVVRFWLLCNENDDWVLIVTHIPALNPLFWWSKFKSKI